jgi:hypothetical protein
MRPATRRARSACPGWTQLGAAGWSGFYNNAQGSPGVSGIVYYRVAQLGDTTSVATITNTYGSTQGFAMEVAEYSGMGSSPVVSSESWLDDTSGSSSSKAMTSVTPTGGAEVLLVYAAHNCPNYTPTAPAGWTRRERNNASGGARHNADLGDQIVASASGSYGGTFTGAGGETAWHIFSAIVTPSGGGGGGGGSGVRAFSPGIIG